MTQSAICDPATGVPPGLRALSDKGIRIAVDGFGTGYSNLALLPELPVCELKLALPLIRGLRSDEDTEQASEHVVSTLVLLAHGLGLSVTAEGIETAEQAERLQKLGCDTGQGWFFARPGPPDALARLIRHNPPV